MVGLKCSCGFALIKDDFLVVAVVDVGSHVFVDDGLIDLVVKSKGADHLVCEITSRMPSCNT